MTRQYCNPSYIDRCRIRPCDLQGASSANDRIPLPRTGWQLLCLCIARHSADIEDCSGAQRSFSSVVEDPRASFSVVSYEGSRGARITLLSRAIRLSAVLSIAPVLGSTLWAAIGRNPADANAPRMVCQPDGGDRA